MVLVSQVEAGQVEVYAKFWEYLLESTLLTITTGAEQPVPKYVPVHTNYYDIKRPQVAEARRKALAEGFHKELSKRIK